MRYIGDLLTQVRERSHNQEYTIGSGTSSIEDVVEGVGNQQLIEFVNEGQTHIQSAIINAHPVEFVVSKEINIVPNQEEYSIPDNVFVNNRLVSVQYTSTGNAIDYYRLPPRPLRDRFTDITSHPSWYIRRSGKILLNPIPTTGVGKIRVEYYREADRLALRAGKISAITDNGTISALTVGTSDDLPNLISNIGDKYLCICDKDGNVKEYNVAYTSYNNGTGVFSGISHARTGTETITTDDYITVGKYTTTHSVLPINCERFLISYGTLMALKLDSSADWQDELAVMQSIKADIIDSFGDMDEDVKDFPVLDSEILF